MTPQQIYDLAISLGIKNDIRGAVHIQRRLKKIKEKYEALPAAQKEFYDKEDLTNPYPDTRMYADDPKKQVKRILAGIDLEVSEVLLANELSKKKAIDLLLFHHPIGAGLSDLSGVMDLQVELLASYGVPINVAQAVTLPRISEVSRGIGAINHYKEVDAAKLLGFPLMCTHTPTDNIVCQFIMNLMKKNESKLERISDVLDLLMTIPEYQMATKLKQGPKIFVGNPDSYAGKIAVTEFTGGTSGSKDMYEKIAQAGIGTILGMHMHEEHKKEAEKHHVNVIIAGHMSSDSLGMNLFLDELEKKGIEVVPCSGLIRVKRFGKKN